MERTLSEIADSLCRRLKKKGFHLLRYDAITTGSIYLKLDYGVCNSIRISDHKGKQKLKYRYNIGTNITKRSDIQDGYRRFYYPAEEEDRLVQQIVSDRKAKQDRYGARYQAFVAENKQRKGQERGFWSSSYPV